MMTELVCQTKLSPEGRKVLQAIIDEILVQMGDNPEVEKEDYNKEQKEIENILNPIIMYVEYKDSILYIFNVTSPKLQFFYLLISIHSPIPLTVMSVVGSGYNGSTMLLNVKDNRMMISGNTSK